MPKPETSLAQFVLTNEKGMAGEITDEEWFLAKINRADNHWIELTDKVLKESDCVLAHMEADEFLYYLPAYMRYSVKHLDLTVDIITTSVIFNLDPLDTNLSLKAFTFSKYKKINSAQRKCIINFLNYISLRGNPFDKESSRRALKFWADNSRSLESAIIVP